MICRWRGGKTRKVFVRSQKQDGAPIAPRFAYASDSVCLTPDKRVEPLHCYMLWAGKSKTLVTEIGTECRRRRKFSKQKVRSLLTVHLTTATRDSRPATK